MNTHKVRLFHSLTHSLTHARTHARTHAHTHADNDTLISPRRMLEAGTLTLSKWISKWPPWIASTEIKTSHSVVKAREPLRGPTIHTIFNLCYITLNMIRWWKDRSGKAERIKQRMMRERECCDMGVER